MQTLIMSPTIGELATALAKFQGEIKDAHKTAQGHNYKYADLGEVLALIRPVASKHGLSLSQFPIDDVMNVGCHNILMHNSGEWIQSRFTMGVTEARGMSAAQSGGSVLSYCRRYSVLGIYGITQIDYDAEVEEPEIVPADETDVALLQEYLDSGELPAKTKVWLTNKENWKNLTRNQATKILAKLKEQENA